jgi:hypothetical protein
MTRLVTTMRSPGAAASSSPTSPASSSRWCSAPSSNSSNPGRCFSAASIASCCGTSRRSRTPSRAASLEAADRGGWTARSSGTNTTSRAAPLPAASARRRTASTASRVLPAPPGPIKLISRDRVSKPASSASSRSRPTKLDCAMGSRTVRCSAGSGPGTGGCPRLAEASSSAMAAAARADGRDRPASHRFTVANDTLSRRASCSWLSPSRARSSRSRSANETASGGSLSTYVAYGLPAVFGSAKLPPVR